MSSATKKFDGPAVVQGCHSKSDETRGRCFREAADAFRLKSMAVQCGKGDTRRPRFISNREFEENWSAINWNPKPTKKRYPRDFRAREDASE